MADREIVDRDTYKKIKKMDRETLTHFILQYGDELLGTQGKTIDLPALEAELSKIKGIGDKRLNEIMVVIEKFLEEQFFFFNKAKSQSNLLKKVALALFL